MAGIASEVLPGPAGTIKEEFEIKEESLDPECSTSTLGSINPVYIKEEFDIKEEHEEHSEDHESTPVGSKQDCSDEELEHRPPKRRSSIKQEPEELNQVLECTQKDTRQNCPNKGVEHHSSGKGAVDPSTSYTRKDKREQAVVPVNPTDSDDDCNDDDDDDEYDESDGEHEILVIESNSDSDDIEVLETYLPVNTQHFTTEPPFKKLREAELDYSDDSPDELPDGRFIPTTIWKRSKNSSVPQSLEALSFKYPHLTEGKNADGEISKETRGAIIALHYEGLSNGEVARWAGVTKPTVVKWVKYYEDNGTTEDEYDLPIPKRSEENPQKDVPTMSDQNKQSATMQGKNNNETSLETRGAIIALHHFGLTNTEVARRTGVTRPTVRTWINRYKTTGTTVDQPRMGRPRCTTSEQDEAIAAAIEANPFSSAVEIQKQLNIPCALQTIRNRLLAKRRQRQQGCPKDCNCCCFLSTPLKS